MAEKKKTQDALNVEDALSKTENFLEKNEKAIIGGVAAVIVIVAAVILYLTFYAGPRNRKAQEALFKGQEYFAMNAYEKALKGDSISFIGFLKVADQFSGTKAANLANAYAGLCYAHLNQPKEAIKYLDKFSAGDQMVAPSIIAAMANCYAKEGNTDKAASLFMKAAKEADNSALSPIFLMEAADIYMSQKKFDKALDAYNTIKDKYFDSYQAQEIDKYIELAKAKK